MKGLGSLPRLLLTVISAPTTRPALCHWNEQTGGVEARRCSSFDFLPIVRRFLDVTSVPHRTCLPPKPGSLLPPPEGTVTTNSTQQGAAPFSAPRRLRWSRGGAEEPEVPEPREPPEWSPAASQCRLPPALPPAPPPRELPQPGRGRGGAA